MSGVRGGGSGRQEEVLKVRRARRKQRSLAWPCLERFIAFPDRSGQFDEAHLDAHEGVTRMGLLILGV